MITPITATTGATMAHAYQCVETARRSPPEGAGAAAGPRAVCSPGVLATDRPVWTAIKPARLPVTSSP